MPHLKIDISNMFSNESHGRPIELCHQFPAVIHHEQERYHPSSLESTCEQWSDVLTIINIAVRGAYPSSPAFDPADPEHFFAYWRDIFTWLHNCVVADSELPTQLASPPIHEFEINFLPEAEDDQSECCPNCCCSCCRENIAPRPSIVLRNDHGVKKGDLVKAVGQYLFFDAETDESSFKVIRRLGAALPYEAGWVGNKGSVWIFCCQPEQLPARVKEGTIFYGQAEAKEESRLMKAK